MFKKITLDNGLRIILAPQKDNMAATVLVLVEAGSKYETKEINGLSHFLEHMCFKGTEKRKRAIDISSELDSLGAQYNAFTGQEYTGYYAKARAEKLPEILDVISDLYLNPVFRQEEIEKERGVIIEEINMYEDLPQRRVAEIFNTLMYGDQPAGWDIAGEKEVVRKMNREDFVNYRAKHYVAEATMVVVAGSFNEEKLVADIKKKFANIVTDKKQGKLAVEESQKGPQIKIQNKKSDQTHLILGVRAFSAQDKRRTTLKVLADIFGGGMSSRLFQRVREELGAAYYVRAGVDLMTDHGSLDVSVGAEHGKVHKVIEVILEEMRKFKDEPVSKKELEKSKEHLIGGFVLGLETSDDLALFTGSQEILRREILEPEEIIKMVRKVTAKDIQELAKFIFDNNKLNLAMIGPYTDKKDRSKFEKILKL